MKFKVGDKVKIIKSPYSDIFIGTISEITEIRVGHFYPKKPKWDGAHLYVLGKLKRKYYNFWEIEKYE